MKRTDEQRVSTQFEEHGPARAPRRTPRATLWIVLCVCALASCQRVPEPEPAPAAASASAAAKSPGVTLPSASIVKQAPPSSASAVSLESLSSKPGQLEKTDLKVGTGDEAKVGDKIRVHYTGTLTDGTKFDSSLDTGKPFEFTLGGGEVIKGWDRGVVGMKVGGKRKLVIPYDLAYGLRGSPPRIPPKATLVFEVELVSIVK